MENIQAARPLHNKVEGESAIRVSTTVVTVFSVQAIISGAPTAATIRLYGTLDNIHFHELVTHIFSDEDLAAESVLFHVVNKPVGSVKFEVLTLTGGTDATMTVYVMEGKQ
jgi:hypothetical protein